MMISTRWLGYYFSQLTMLVVPLEKYSLGLRPSCIASPARRSSHSGGECPYRGSAQCFRFLSFMFPSCISEIGMLLNYYYYTIFLLVLMKSSSYYYIVITLSCGFCPAVGSNKEPAKSGSILLYLPPRLHLTSSSNNRRQATVCIHPSCSSRFFITFLQRIAASTVDNN